jgi:protein-S-isoprenylcysteine O-methyltransferase Ste14
MGAGVLACCMVAFVRTQGTPGELVVDGRYRWVRNPMCAGAPLVVLGHVAYAASWPPLIYAFGL